MIDCTNAEIRDALPDLLNGKLSEADATILREHATGCEACRQELALLREIRESAALAPAIDAAAIAARIPAYASPAITTPEVRRPGTFASVWKVAAAAAIVTAGIIGLTRGSSRPITAVESGAVAVAPAVVEAVPSTPLATPVQTALSSEQRVASLSLVGNLQDLSDDDLEQLIADLDGITALPSTEPQSVTTSLDDTGIDQ
jgi:anti-sigma factor RsiW